MKAIFLMGFAAYTYLIARNEYESTDDPKVAFAFLAVSFASVLCGFACMIRGV